MQVKAWAQEVRAFRNFRSADGTDGATALESGIQFKNGLYVGGTFTASALPISTDNISITGTAGNGYIQYVAQTSPPASALVHTFSDSGGHFAIGQSGSSGKTIAFTNGLMTANRDYAFQDKSGTLAMTDDNVSQFVNDSLYASGPGGATSGNITTFDGTSGQLLQDSGIAIGSVVLTSRTLTEGAGLAGNTYSLAANRTLAMGTPSTLSVATTNGASGTTHTHVITTSSNPGTAAQILATDASGYLTLRRLTLTDYLFVNSTTANLYLKDTSTGLQVSSSGIINPQSGNAFRTTSFTSGVVGWNVSNVGDAEFNNVRIRGELAASVFKVSEVSATAGTFGVFYSASTVYEDFTTAAATGFGPGDFDFKARNSDVGGMLFAVGDIVRFKSWTGSAISDAWARVNARTNNTTYTLYNSTLLSGSTSATFRAGTAAIDYGPSGTGFITLSTDGTVGSSPNMTMATHAGSPWSTFTTLLRLGNLNGSYGYATDVYGLGIGQYGTASKSWQTIDQTNGYRIGNNTTVLVQFDVSGNATFGQVANSKANAYWNAGNSRLEFRGSTSGTVVQTYIDTDGSFVAGSGNVVLNSTGLILSADSANYVQWKSGATLCGTLAAGNPLGSTSLVVLSATRAAISSNLYLTATTTDAWVTLNGATGPSGFSGLAIGPSAVNGSPTEMLDVYGRIKSQGSVAALQVVSRTGALAWTWYDSDASGIILDQAGFGTRIKVTATGGNLCMNTATPGTSAASVIAIPNGTAPSTSPPGVGQLYVESGSLKFCGGSGTITTVAPA